MVSNIGWLLRSGWTTASDTLASTWTKVLDTTTYVRDQKDYWVRQGNLYVRAQLRGAFNYTLASSIYHLSALNLGYLNLTLALTPNLLCDRILPREVTDELRTVRCLILPPFPKESYAIDIREKEQEIAAFSQELLPTLQVLTRYIVHYLKTEYLVDGRVFHLFREKLPPQVYNRLAPLLNNIDMSKLTEEDYLNLDSYIYFYLLEAGVNLVDLLKKDEKLIHHAIDCLVDQEGTLAANIDQIEIIGRSPELLVEKPLQDNNEVIQSESGLFNLFLKPLVVNVEENGPLHPMYTQQQKNLLSISRNLIQALLPQRLSSLDDVPLHTQELLYFLIQEKIVPALLDTTVQKLTKKQEILNIIVNALHNQNNPQEDLDPTAVDAQSLFFDSESVQYPKEETEDHQKATVVMSLLGHLLPSLQPLITATEQFSDIVDIRKIIEGSLSKTLHTLNQKAVIEFALQAGKTTLEQMVQNPDEAPQDPASIEDFRRELKQLLTKQRHDYSDHIVDNLFYYPRKVSLALYKFFDMCSTYHKKSAEDALKGYRQSLLRCQGSVFKTVSLMIKIFMCRAHITATEGMNLAAQSVSNIFSLSNKGIKSVARKIQDYVLEKTIDAKVEEIIEHLGLNQPEEERSLVLEVLVDHIFDALDRSIMALHEGEKNPLEMPMPVDALPKTNRVNVHVTEAINVESVV